MLISSNFRSNYSNPANKTENKTLKFGCTGSNDLCPELKDSIARHVKDRILTPEQKQNFYDKAYDQMKTFSPEDHEKGVNFLSKQYNSPTK